MYTNAWFANNNKVTASGMNVTAQTEGANLEVSFTDQFTAGTIAVSGNEKTAILIPTHVVTASDIGTTGSYNKAGSAETNFVAGDWAHAYSAQYSQVFTDDTYKNAEKVSAVGTESNSVTTTKYAMVVPVYLRLNPQSKNAINNITATATITQKSDVNTDSTGMTTAGRVAFITNATNKTIIGGQGYATGEVSATLIDTLSIDGTPQVVYAVIYFDGDDNSCTSEKFDTDNYSVSLIFEGTIATDA